MKAVCAAVQPSLLPFSPRLFVYVRSLGTYFLIDTGSDVSVLPKRLAKTANSATIDYRLYAVDGSPILTYGTEEVTLEIGLPKSLRWNFVVADIQQPIIGADLLSHFRLLPDLNRRLLIDGANLCSAQCSIRHSNLPSVSSISCSAVDDQRLVGLLRQNDSVLKPPQYHKQVQHDVLCYIETTGPPSYEKSRRLRPDIEQKVKAEYRRMVDVGLCRVSRSQWAAPLIVKQEKSKMRLIGDYKRLNAKTVPDRYPIPVLHDSTGLLYGKTIFSSIDLVRAFHNIPVFFPDIEKTAVISPAGLFDYCRMPFGLRNAPSTFQRFMNSIFSDLPFVFIYIDDILIFSDSTNEHYDHLNCVFQRLAKHGLSINLDKCRFLVSELVYLGHHVSAAGFRPTDERIAFVKEMKPPKTIAALRSILGLLNFYRRFTSKAAEHLAPLNELLKGHPKKNDRSRILWTDELNAAFENARKSFINFTLLHFPKQNSKLILTCDASRVAVGAVLEQIGDDGTL